MASRFLEGNQICSAFVPVDMSAAANDGDWVNLRNYGRLVVVLFKAAGTNGQDPVFTLRQAQDNTGTGAKALPFDVVWEKVGTLTDQARGTFVRRTQTPANTYTNTDSAEAQAIIAVEVLAEDLDVNNNFTHVQLQIPDVGAAAQLGCAFYLLLDPRFRAATSLTAID